LRGAVCPADSEPEARRAGREFAAARPRPLPEGPLFFGYLDSRFAKKLVPPANGSKAGAAGSPDTPASAGIVSGAAPTLEARPSQHRSKERGECLRAHGRRGGRPRSLAAQSGQ
jgi:hypothetical protein